MYWSQVYWVKLYVFAISASSLEVSSGLMISQIFGCPACSTLAERKFRSSLCIAVTDTLELMYVKAVVILSIGSVTAL